MDKTEAYKAKYKEEDAVGWMAIDEALNEVYGQLEPRHYGPANGLHYAAGGQDPIDGISIYDHAGEPPHLHLISYGMSELYYAPEKANEEFSKWGFEFTCRLLPFAEDEGDPFWLVHVFNNLARYVYQSGRWFEENQFIPAKGPVRLNTDTAIVGFVTALDPELGRIQTAHGEVSFIQLYGVTQKELDVLLANASTDYVAAFIAKVKETNPLLITDLTRTDNN